MQMNNLVSKADYANIVQKLDKQLMGELARIDDDFRPGKSYIEEWGYTVLKQGHIGYQMYDQVPQSPKRGK